MIDKIEIISKIFQLILIPLITIITPYLVKFIQTKSQEISNSIENEFSKKYIEMLSETISACVLATNQTYVNTLKKENKFDAEAQKKAFQDTYNAVMTILTDEAKSYLSIIYGDLEKYISERIEAAVLENKLK